MQNRDIPWIWGIEAQETNKIWELVKLMEGKSFVGCKWVYSVKYKVNESIERHKMRLVAKWYTQIYGIVYLNRGTGHHFARSGETLRLADLAGRINNL